MGIVVFAGALVVAMVTKAPSLDILLGVAGANVTMTFSYWLGSSRGSQKKDDALAAVATSPTVTTTSTLVPPTTTTTSTGGANPLPPAP